jgi:ribosomal protein L21E
VLVQKYMDARGAVMLGKSEEEKALEERRRPVESKRRSENGVPMYQYPSGLRVDIHGKPSGKTAPHHHRVYQGYQLGPVAGASRKRPRVETAVESDSDSPSDSDSD